MLNIIIPKNSLYDSKNNEFIDIKETTLQLEHSLISLKKWEQKWHKPFLGKGEEDKTYEEIIDYIKCMTINKVDDDCYKGLTKNNIIEVVDYIKNPMTATWFKDNKLIGAANNPNEIVTAEIIYYWMIALGIPSEYQKWHLNSLLTLIKVVNIKQQPSKKMAAKDAAAQRRAINAQRRAMMHSKG